MKLRLLIICLILRQEDFSTAKSGLFTKLTIPAENVVQSPELGKYRLSDCISFCLQSETSDCDVVIHENSDNSCSFGSIVLPPDTESKIFTKEEGEEPTSVIAFGKGSVIKPRSGYVPILVSIHNSQVTQQRLSSDPGVSGDPPSGIVGSLPLGEASASDIQATLVVHYGNGFVSCGGVTVAAQMIRTCSQWSYKTKVWTTLEGEMSMPHVLGAGIFLDNKLYVFMGSNSADGFSPVYPTAETYDFSTKKWDPLPDVPYSARNPMVVATSATEILIAQGIVPGCCYRSDAHVYNTQSRQYTNVGPVPNVDSRGLWLFDCKLPKGSLILICIGGTNEWALETNRVQRFDTVNLAWLTPRDSDNMPSGMIGRFVSIPGRMSDYLDKIYYVDDITKSVYEIHYDHENDGQVTSTDLAINSSLWGFQMLVPAYYDEILVNT